MLTVDEALLRDPLRLAAVERMRPVMNAVPVLVDAVAATAARLLTAPMALVSLVAEGKEYISGAYDPADSFSGQLERAVGRYVVGVDRCATSADVLNEPDQQLRQHLLAERYGVRAFLGVPLLDSDKHQVGCLTVLDVKTRQWSDEETSLLAELVTLLHPAVLAAVTPPADALDQGALLDSVQEAFLAVDPDGVVVSWNRAAQELLGFAADEVCGRHLDDSLLPDYDGVPIGAALARLFSAAPRRRVSRPVTVRHRDGHRLTAHASLSVLPAASGPLACVFLTDLSRQVAAEDAAERNDRFLMAVLDSLSPGVIACDDRGKIVLLNQALRNTQGLPATAPVPDDYAETAAVTLRHPDMAPMSWAQTPLMRALHGEHVRDSDLLIQAPGERLRTFATTAQPIVGRDGRRLGAVAVAHEVTAMRRAEQFRECHLAVARSLAAADTPQQAAPGVLHAVATTLRWPLAELWIVDEAGEALRSVGHWSAPGLDPGDLVGRTVVKGSGVTGRVWATGRPIWISDVADLAEVADLTPALPRAVIDGYRDLGIRTVLAVPVKDGDTTLGVLTCYADAVEQHEDLLIVLLDGVAAQVGMFVALCITAELNHQLDRAKDDFIALVGHEMRTPLTSIAANASMLGEDSDTFAPDHQQMLHAIQRNATAVQGIVNALLDLAGLDAGYLGLAADRIDLVEILAAAVAAAAPQATASGVRFSHELPAHLMLDGDAKRLRQVVDDLLSNAVKYSPNGGDVHIRVRIAGAMADLEISDSGIGIPENERHLMFKRFYRGSNVRHHGTPGSGLGLSLARAIVELHGGAITLTARRPSGTTVRVQLPLTAP
ncbi:ATP-binding protein [Actinoplanes sp. NPDC026619]|uniref:PAS domain-containing sensor histidine kinase n=1 Tax=Actinoplanes sp. NPDC026619 TaxID=3155798 RepID=UPI0033D8D5B1